jgi:hypothetical protein
VGVRNTARFELLGGAVITTRAARGRWVPRDEGVQRLQSGATGSIVVDDERDDLAWTDSPSGRFKRFPGGFAAVRLSADQPARGRGEPELEALLRQNGLRRRPAHQLWWYRDGRFVGLLAVEPVRERPSAAGCISGTSGRPRRRPW